MMSLFGSIEDKLKKAIEKNNVKSVRKLLGKGANLKKLDEKYNYFDSLTHAIKTTNNLEIAEVLLEHGADAEVSGFVEPTLLMECSFEGNIGAVKLLIKYNANVNDLGFRNYKPITALLTSLRPHDENIEVTRELLKSGADPSLSGGDDYITGMMEHLKDLYDGGSGSIGDEITRDSHIVNTLNIINTIPLVQAIMVGCVDTVSELLYHGANANINYYIDYNESIPLIDFVKNKVQEEFGKGEDRDESNKKVLSIIEKHT